VIVAVVVVAVAAVTHLQELSSGRELYAFARTDVSRTCIECTCQCCY
jgi:hypothetical protein